MKPLSNVRILKLIKQRQKNALEAVGAFIEKEAERICPKDTYNLSASITYATVDNVSRVRSPAKQSTAVSKPEDDDAVRIGTKVKYAPYVEYGTYKMSAQPYLRPAVLDNKKRIKGIFLKMMKKK
jgi:HK97 gp10 family phage protein